MDNTADLNALNIDSEDQWSAWRIGRDSRAENRTPEKAQERLLNCFGAARSVAMTAFFEAGFSGEPSPPCPAPNPA